jgi:CxxC-x17-CxxC domain-containing protein
MFNGNKKQKGAKTRYKSSFGGQSSYGGKRSYGGNKSSGAGPSNWKNGGMRKEGHQATCGDCSKSCTVPFKPNGKKPVLCSSCFRGNEGGFEKKRFGDKPSYGRSNDRSSFNRSSDRPSFNRQSSGPDLKREIDQVNRKLDQILALLNDSSPKAHKPKRAPEAKKARETPFDPDGMFSL